MEKPRYILTVSLVKVTGERGNMPIHTQMVYRSYSEGDTRLQFDSLIDLCKQKGITLENDPISRESRRTQ